MTQTLKIIELLRKMLMIRHIVTITEIECLEFENSVENYRVQVLVAHTICNTLSTCTIILFQVYRVFWKWNCGILFLDGAYKMFSSESLVKIQCPFTWKFYKYDYNFWKNGCRIETEKFGRDSPFIKWNYIYIFLIFQVFSGRYDCNCSCTYFI